jgi:hypothetical protein
MCGLQFSREYPSDAREPQVHHWSHCIYALRAELARVAETVRDLYERMDCPNCRTSPDFTFCDDCLAARERAHQLTAALATTEGAT